MDEIIQIISQLGFPIAVALCAMYMIWKQTQRTQDFLESELRSRDDRTNVLLSEIQDGIHDIRTIIQMLAKQGGDDLK